MRNITIWFVVIFSGETLLTFTSIHMVNSVNVLYTLTMTIVGACLSQWEWNASAVYPSLEALYRRRHCCLSCLHLKLHKMYRCDKNVMETSNSSYRRNHGMITGDIIGWLQQNYQRGYGKYDGAIWNWYGVLITR